MNQPIIYYSLDSDESGIIYIFSLPNDKLSLHEDKATIFITFLRKQGFKIRIL